MSHSDLFQLNTDRTSLRRKPQVITSVVQPFDENVFNFNKVNECEVLLRCQNRLNDVANSIHGTTTFLVNNSPITKYHSLICPRLTENLSQVITRECIEFAIDLMTGLNERSYRIGYNSLGAFSSVNHLHLHLIHVTEKMYVEDAVSQSIHCLQMKWQSFFSISFLLPSLGNHTDLSGRLHIRLSSVRILFTRFPMEWQSGCRWKIGENCRIFLPRINSTQHFLDIWHTFQSKFTENFHFSTQQSDR